MLRSTRPIVKGFRVPVELWPTLPYAESSPTGGIFGGLSLQPLYRRTRVACISTSRADLLRYPMRRLNSALHPPIPSGRMFTRKEDPAFSASIDRNPVQFARTKRRKTATLPQILAPALHSSRRELFPGPRKHNLGIGNRLLHPAMHIHRV